ncbi:MAG: hypothetical protein JSV80_04170 [Acidobacteriota bacterium]|nr:MAG: hypothetical protein JSV80_04170 [Acidobacteriota bacterium]
MAGKTSPWVYVGIGCLALVLVSVTCVGVGLFGFMRWARNLEQTIKDPVTREQRVKELLGIDDIPDGYYAMLGMELPFIARVAMLSDRAPNEAGKISGFGERGFIYVDFIRKLGQKEAALRDFFEGRRDDPSVLEESGINIDVDELIDRGVVQQDEAELLYVSQRGNVTAHGHSGRGITTLVLVECGIDKRMRLAVWFGPDPNPDARAAELDLTGTPADARAIADFMGQFRLCPSDS